MTTPASAAARSSFVSRAVVSAIAVAVIVALTWADAIGLGGARPVWWLLPLAVLVVLRGTAECAGLFATRGVHLRTGVVMAAAVSIVLSAAAGGAAFAATATLSPLGTLGWTALACAAACGLVMAAEIPGYRAGGGALDRVTAGTFTALAIGLPLAFMVALRLLCVENLGPEQRGPEHLGVLPLVSLIAVVKAGDILAYVVGSLVGRTKMAPVLSPGKTWEGAVGSLAGSLLAAWLVFERAGFATQARPWGGWLVFGLVVGVAGMLGDLAESLVKRELGAKDSGRLLGGLGGVLDLIDSLSFAAPIAWLLWVA
ncbi:MAG: phosphatidate cytidylyltransferase [Pirellulales bacterium]